MPDDLTNKVFAGVQRMIEASSKALLLSVREMIDTVVSRHLETVWEAIKEIPAGPQGAAGEPGLQGPAGPIGERGPQGEKGLDGIGERGDPGPVGMQGEQGLVGFRGPPGETGPPGPAGVVGDRGPLGERGAQGERGIDGKDAQGLPGPAGAVGPQGERGAEGLPGRDGRDALPMPGPQGAQGEKGADGRDGKDGKDSDVSKAEIASVVAAAVQESIATVMKTLHFEGRMMKLGDVDITKFPPSVDWRDVFQPGTAYEAGQAVAWGGSSYICVEPTSDKPDQNDKAWKLIAKKGRDSR